MKKYKNFILHNIRSFEYIRILFVAIACMVLVSCSDKKDPYFPEPSQFSVAFEVGNTIDATGGTLAVRINAGTNGWWVVIPPESSWCTVNQMFGSGDKTVTVRVTANNTGADRQTIITINPTFNLSPQTITVIQSK